MNQELVGQDIRVDAPGALFVRVVVEAALAFLEAAGVEEPSASTIESSVRELVGESAVAGRTVARLVLGQGSLEVELVNGAEAPRSVTCAL